MLRVLESVSLPESAAVFWMMYIKVSLSLGMRSVYARIYYIYHRTYTMKIQMLRVLFLVSLPE